MSSRSGNKDMEADFDWSDAAFEAALRGDVGAPPRLAAFVSTTLFELTDPIEDELAKHHVSTTAAVARSVAHSAAQAAAAAAAAPVVAATATSRRRRLRRLTFAGAFSGMWAKVALGAVAMAAVGTGAAVTDNLPAPIQAVVSNVADSVGVDLPHPDDALAPAVGPDLESLPPGGGASDEGRNQAQEQQEYRQCVADAEALGMTPEDAACERPTPPGLEDTDGVPPGQDEEFTPPGQDEEFTPPGQDEERTPPGQEDRTPPGRDKGN